MEQEKYNIESGEQKAWRELLEADPAAVERNSLAAYYPDGGTYSLEIMGETYAVDPKGRAVKNITNPGRKPEYFVNLAAPIYLAQAKDMPPTGELVKELKGGGFFFRGSHTLPLEAIAEKYGKDKALFEEACGAMGGTRVKLGDAAFTIYFFPKVPMTFVLWLEDEEFPARVSLLFDSGSDRHMALDVVWAIALVACQRLLSYRPIS